LGQQRIGARDPPNDNGRGNDAAKEREGNQENDDNDWVNTVAVTALAAPAAAAE
jgi:hypothetical protein